MSGSFNFLLHLLGFGFLVTALLGGWMIERRSRREKDLVFKRILLRAGRAIGLLSPIAALILLVTGIINIISVYPTNPMIWHSQGWLMAKVILFAFMVVNGVVFGPIISRRRSRLVETMISGQAAEDAEQSLSVLEKNLTTYYLVQTLLLLLILFLSIFGSGKHPGLF
jgi:hypothetical protein